jgi:hypothetical protein
MHEISGQAQTEKSFRLAVTDQGIQANLLLSISI